MKWQNRAMPLPWSDYPQGAVDGDTLDLLLDLGHHQYAAHRARLAGVDTAEKWGTAHDSEEYQLAVEQTAFTADWVAAATANFEGTWPLLVETHKSGKYGRLVADVMARSHHGLLQDALVDEWPEVDDGR